MNDEGEIEFLRTYKDFIYYFNMLERNVGCFLRNCSRIEGIKNPDKLLSVSFNSKVKRVISLADKYGLHASFYDWYVQVEGCRRMRNIISHGQWEWHWWKTEPIYFHAPDIEHGEGTFTPEEFREKLVYLKNVSKIFHKISRSLAVAVEMAERSVDEING